MLYAVFAGSIRYLGQTSTFAFTYRVLFSFLILIVCSHLSVAQTTASPFKSGSQFLQCITRTADNGPNGQHTPARATAKLSEFEAAAGYVRTGGGCVQNHALGGEVIPGYIFQNAPAGDRGWTCEFSDQPGWPNQPGGGPFHIARAYVIGCRVLAHGSVIGQIARWTTPASGWPVTVARNGTNYDVSIPLSVRLCSLEGVDTLNVWYGRDNLPDEIGDVVPPIQLAPGKCIQVDKPRQITVQNATSVERAQAGTYEFFAKGTFGERPEIVDAKAAERGTPQKSPVRQALRLEAAEERVAKCEPFSEPKPEGVWGACVVPNIDKNASYRVCFGPEYTTPQNDVPYPGTLVPMALDLKIARSKPLPNYDNRFNAIVAGGCRDIFSISEMFFVLRPEKSDGTWDPAKVGSVKMTIQRIKPQ